MVGLSRPRALHSLGVVAFSTLPGLLHLWLEFGSISLRFDQLSLGFIGFATPVLDIDFWLGLSSLGWVTFIGRLFHLPSLSLSQGIVNLLTGLSVTPIGSLLDKLVASRLLVQFYVIYFQYCHLRVIYISCFIIDVIYMLY